MIKYWDIRSLQTCKYMNNLEFQSKDRVTLDIVATFEEARPDYEICQTTLRVYRNLHACFSDTFYRYAPSSFSRKLPWSITMGHVCCS